MLQPKISVIMPVYNMEKYLEQCLDSLVNQTIGLENLQIIMVNDASTDNSEKIMNQYSRKYPSFIAINLKENTGSPSTPKNIGVEKAEGEYLIFLDPDDYLPTNAYEILYNSAKQNKSDFVMGSITRFNANKVWKQPQLNTPLLQRNHPNINIQDKPEFLSVLGYLVNKLIKTSFFKGNNFTFDPEIKLGEDFIISNQLMLKADRFSYIPDNVYFYRMREDEDENSLTQLEPMEAIDNFVKTDDYLYQVFENQKQKHLYRYSNLQSVKSIIYRLNDDFLALQKEEQQQTLKLALPCIKRFDDSLLDELSDFDQGLIYFYKDENIENLLLYIKYKVERNNAFKRGYELQLASKELNKIFKSRYWKITKPFRRIRAKVRGKLKKGNKFIPIIR
ncbi:glycosyltransferase family 2 protein [Bacillus nitroreducens]